MQHRFSIRLLGATTKGQMKQLRLQGQIPVSIQHRGLETLHFQTEAKPLDDFVRGHGEAAMVQLVDEQGVTHRALVHDVQRNAIGQRLLQVTFQGVEGEEYVKVHIPLRFQGEPETLRLHTASLQHSMEQVEVRCRPDDIPDHITVDMSQMTLNVPLRVRDLKRSAKVEILTDGNTVVASLSNLHLSDGADAAPVVEAA